MDEASVNDLRIKDISSDGFACVHLYDADDHDCILVHEDAIPVLLKFLESMVKKYNLTVTA